MNFTRLDIVVLLFSALLAMDPGRARAEPEMPPQVVDLVEPTAAEKTLRAALEKPIDVAVVNAPLVELMRDVAKKHSINIDVDEKALKDIGVDPKSTVTLALQGVTLRNVLRRMLAEMDLTYIVRDGVLVITNTEEAGARMLTRIYDVRGLGIDPARPGEAPDIEAIADLIANSVAPTTWDHVGGPATIDVVKETLVVQHHSEIHEEIELLLAALRKAKASYDQWNGRERPIPNLPATSGWLVYPREEPEWKPSLAKPVTLSFDKTPLDDAIAAIKDLTKIPIVIDAKGLKDVGLDEKKPVTIDCRNLPLDKALRQMLREHDLTYYIRDGVVLIAPPETDHSILFGVYPVFDLAAPPLLSDIAADRRDAPLNANELIARIRAQTPTWEGSGPGVIQYHAASGSLVMHNYRDEMEQAAAFLAALRKISPIVPKPDGEKLQRELITVRHGPFTLEWLKQARPSRPAGSAETAAPGLPADRVATDKLAESIRAFIEPKSWDVEDGPKIVVFPDRLLIRQTRPMHARIARFLAETLDIEPSKPAAK